MYHSPACKQAAYRKRKKPEYLERETFVRYCKNCGQKFLTHYPRRVFHSTSCRVSYSQTQKRLLLKEVQDVKDKSDEG